MIIARTTRIIIMDEIIFLVFLLNFMGIPLSVSYFKFYGTATHTVNHLLKRIFYNI